MLRVMDGEELTRTAAADPAPGQPADTRVLGRELIDAFGKGWAKDLLAADPALPAPKEKSASAIRRCDSRAPPAVL